jgi:SAM-dependent methyltransferase
MNQICNICNSPSVSFLGKIEGYRVNTYFDVMTCNACNSSFTFPYLADEKLYESIYKNVEMVPGYSRYYQYARQILNEKDPLDYLANLEDCYWGIIQAVLTESKIKKNIDLVLEVGCGQGYLTYALARAGFNAVGLDVSESAVAMARERYGEYYYCEEISKYFNRTNERPSIIILSEVIEHLSDPFSLLKELFSYLKPGGIVIATTPNKDACLTGAIWDTDLPPVHLWWMTQKGLEAIGGRLSCTAQFADFDKFYSNHLLFTTSAEIKVDKRNSIFDEDYRLIEKNNQRASFFSSTGKLFLKKFIPNNALRRLQLKKAQNNGLSRLTASNPASLCVTYRAVKS